MAKARDSTAQIKGRITAYRYGLANNVDRAQTSELASLKSDLERGDFYAVKVLPASLRILASCYSARGLVDILDKGKLSSWRQVDLALTHQYWGVKLSIGAIFKALHKGLVANELFLQIPDAASLLCYAYVHGLTEIRDEFWDFWKRILATPESVSKNYWSDKEQGMYELFVFQVFASGPFGKGEVLPDYVRGKSLAPYQAVLDAWHNPKDLVEPLTAICDYHCQKMEQRSPNHALSAFKSAPFDLLPYDILAIYKLRGEQGLETPEIDHPLLKLPTASRTPRKVTAIDDPIFPRLEKLYREQCLA